MEPFPCKSTLKIDHVFEQLTAALSSKMLHCNIELTMPPLATRHNKTGPPASVNCVWHLLWLLLLLISQTVYLCRRILLPRKDTSYAAWISSSTWDWHAFNCWVYHQQERTSRSGMAAPLEKDGSGMFRPVWKVLTLHLAVQANNGVPFVTSTLISWRHRYEERKSWHLKDTCNTDRKLFSSSVLLCSKL